MAEMLLSSDSSNWELVRQISRGGHYLFKAIAFHVMENCIVSFIDDYDKLFEHKNYYSTIFRRHTCEAVFMTYNEHFSSDTKNVRLDEGLSYYSYDVRCHMAFTSEIYVGYIVRKRLAYVNFDVEELDIPKYKKLFSDSARQLKTIIKKRRA